MFGIIRRSRLVIIISVILLLSLIKLKSSHDQLEALKSFDNDPNTSLNIVNPYTATYGFNLDATLSVYLHHINQNIESGIEELPFHWYDWVNLTALNNFINLPPSEKLDCTLVCQSNINARGLEILDEIFRTKKARPVVDDNRRTRNKAKGRGRCADYCRTDKSTNMPGFRVFRNLFKGGKTLKHYHSISYLYSEAYNPYSLVISNSRGNLQIPIRSNNGIDDKSEMNMLRSGLYKTFLDNEQVFDVSYQYNKLLNHIQARNPIDINKNQQIELDHDRFTFDGPSYISSLDSSLAASAQQTRFKKSLEASLHRKDSLLPKHFSEALLTRDSSISKIGHIDWRFFSGVTSFDEFYRFEVFERMLKTWFQFTLNEGVVSWIAHGGLLAHSFNGMLFPYDDDIDIQMPYRDLARLAEHFNNSLILEDLEDNTTNQKRLFLLDVTDSITHRSKGNGLNNIDARLIDIQTGLYIDITALGVSASYLPIRYEEKVHSLQDYEGIQFKDPNVIINDFYEPRNDKDRNSLKQADYYLYNTLRKNPSFAKPPSSSSTLGKTFEERYDLNYRLQIYNCRNHHFYELKDLSPLRMSYLNGVPILIPNDVSKIFRDEFRPQTLLTSYFSDYVFLPQLRIWVSLKFLKDFYSVRDGTTEFDILDKDLNLLTQVDIIQLLGNKEILRSFMRSWEFSLLNEKEKMILRDQTLGSASLHELLTDRKLLPRYDLDGLTDAELYSMAKSQLEAEYSNSVDYDHLGRNKEYQPAESFNNIGWTIKQILELYREDKYDPDIDLKIRNVEEQLKHKQTEKGRAPLESKLERLKERKQLLEKVVVHSDLPKLKVTTDYSGFAAQAQREKEKAEKEAADEQDGSQDTVNGK